MLSIVLSDASEIFEKMMGFLPDFIVSLAEKVVKKEQEVDRPFSCHNLRSAAANTGKLHNKRLVEIEKNLLGVKVICFRKYYTYIKYIKKNKVWVTDR